MNWNKTKNFISFLMKLALLVILVISVVCVIIALIIEDYQRATAIATTILAGTALYATRQISIMKKRNYADPIKECIMLENKVRDFAVEKISPLRKILRKKLALSATEPAGEIDIQKLPTNKQKSIRELVYEVLNAEAIYFNHIDNLCYYILLTQKRSDDLGKNIKAKHKRFVKNLYNNENLSLRKELVHCPHIHRLMKIWELN